MKKLKIAQIAPLWYKIPPEKYGGIELVIYNLTEELVKRGHKVTLFASGDSKTSAKLFPTIPYHLKKSNTEWTDKKYTILNLFEAFKRSDDFDIIHSHVDLYDLFFAPFVKTPAVSTMHNRLMIDEIKKKDGGICRKGEERIDIYGRFRHHKIITISKAQEKLSLVKMNFVGNVYNGIDLDDFRYNPKGSDHFIWIGRMHRFKGVGNAVRAAKQLGIKLTMAGRVKDDNEEAYFNEEIKPYMDNDRIKYIGEISFKEKSDFFGNAKALLYPIEWDEPFGLVMTEAMACGTPVIAFDRGSVSEIVKDGKTGFVVPPFNKKGEPNIEGLAEAIKKIDMIDRSECRRLVEEEFTNKKMVDRYEEIYHKILSR